MADVVSVTAVLAGVAAIVWGAEAFAEHLAPTAVALRVSTFALALLLAGAEPEELATGIAASLRHAPAVAFGDVIGANVAMCLVALGVGAVVAPLPFGRRVRRYGLAGLPLGAACAALGLGRPRQPSRGAVLVALYAAYVGCIWIARGRAPGPGRAAELDEAKEGRCDHRSTPSGPGPADDPGWDRGHVRGATLLVEGVRHLAHADASQTRLGLTVVGFATAFELGRPGLVGRPPRSNRSRRCRRGGQLRLQRHHDARRLRPSETATHCPSRTDSRPPDHHAVGHDRCPVTVVAIRTTQTPGRRGAARLLPGIRNRCHCCSLTNDKQSAFHPWTTEP